MHLFKHTRIVTTLAMLFAALVAPRSTAQIPVVYGDTITEPGVYFLAGNQTGTGTGITIDSDDVVLLLTRFTLRGDGSNTGIYSELHRNVQIYGGRITECHAGIELNACEAFTVQGTRIDHCGADGVRLAEGGDSWFLRMRLDHNRDDGVDSRGSDDNRFISVQSHDNGGDGIILGPGVDELVGPGGTSGSDDNKVKLCWLAYNDANGIDVLNSDSNALERNQCIGNGDTGIRLHERAEALGEAAGQDPNGAGPNDNFLRSNWCVFNTFGIIAEQGAVANTITNNTALANADGDLIDLNPLPCENTWFLNFFLVRSGEGELCIF